MNFFHPDHVAQRNAFTCHLTALPACQPMASSRFEGRSYHDRTAPAPHLAAHARALLTGPSLTVPFNAGRLLLGTWQGIYLFEHRTHGQLREIIVTLLGG